MTIQTTGYKTFTGEDLSQKYVEGKKAQTKQEFSSQKGVSDCRTQIETMQGDRYSRGFSTVSAARVTAGSGEYTAQKQKTEKALAFLGARITDVSKRQPTDSELIKKMESAKPSKYNILFNICEVDQTRVLTIGSSKTLTTVENKPCEEVLKEYKKQEKLDQEQNNTSTVIDLKITRKSSITPFVRNFDLKSGAIDLETASKVLESQIPVWKASSENRPVSPESLEMLETLSKYIGHVPIKGIV